MAESEQVIVLCHGTFDVLHVGHIWHLRAARAMGDRLVVSLTADAFRRKPGHRKFNQDERADHLRELRCVDDVYICNGETAARAIVHYRPRFFVKGIDYRERGIAAIEQATCLYVGARVVYTDTKKYGSGSLVEHVR